MPTILVDADACPVKAEVMRVAERHGWPVIMVANQYLHLPVHPLLRFHQVGDRFDEADDWIVDQAAAGDVVISADIPLASRCLEKGARVLGPSGRPFTAESIGAALAMRGLNQYLRESGAIAGHNPSFTKADRSSFLSALEQAIQQIKRHGA